MGNSIVRENKRRRTIRVIHGKAVSNQATELVGFLREQAELRHMSWRLATARITSLTTRALRASKTPVDTILYLDTADLRESSITAESAAGLEEELTEAKTNLLCVQVSSGRPLPKPFGFPRGGRCMECGDPFSKSGAQQLFDWMSRKPSLQQPAPIGASEAIHRILRKGTLSQYSNAIRPFITKIEENEGKREHALLIQTALYLLEWIGYVSELNDDNVRTSTLRHSAKVLEYLNRICVVPTGRIDKWQGPGPGVFSLQSGRDAFLALFAALLHNQPLQRNVPGCKDGTYVTNAPRFLERTRVLREQMCRGLPARPCQLVASAFAIGIEMFKDSLYWNEAARNDRRVARGHRSKELEIDSDSSKIPVALRICDIMDVGHRVVPDLVRNLFSSAGYSKGLNCFFRNTFHLNRDFLFATSPRFDNLQLTLTWPDKMQNRRIAVIEAVAVMVEGAVRKTLGDLEILGGCSNLAIHLVVERGGPVRQKYEDGIVWAFFPLAVELPPSDSAATEIAVDMLPVLIDYVVKAGGTTNGNDNWIKENVEELLRVVGGLRRNSHYLPTIVGQLQKTLSGRKPGEYGKLVRRVLESEQPQKNEHQWSERRRVADSYISTKARCFFVYGESWPVTEWLVELGNRLAPGESIRVIFLYCRRKLLIKAPTSMGSQSSEYYVIHSVSEHESARDLLRNEIKTRRVPRGRIVIDEEIWDMEHMPTLDEPREGTEVLFGARRFVVEGTQRSVVGNYGTDLLSACAQRWGMSVRVVTVEERFRDSLSTYGTGNSANTFSVSYSHSDRPNAEDERVPLEQISVITTEGGEYNANEVRGKLAASTTDRMATNEVRRSKSTIRKPKAPRTNLEELLRAVRPIVILTAANIEYEVATNLAGIEATLNERMLTLDGLVYVDLGFEYPVILHHCRPGSSVVGGSFQKTTELCRQINPYAVIVAGLCFGLKPSEQRIGDILLPQQIRLYENARMCEDRVILRGSRPDTSYVLWGWFANNIGAWNRRTPKRDRPQVHSGLMLSGDKLVDDPEFVKSLLKQESEAIGGDMEAAGVYAALNDTDIKWVVVKGICDWGTHKTKTDQKAAARNAFDFIYDTLNQKHLMGDLMRKRRKK